MKKIAILGSTGSIGTQALEVIKKLPNEFKVVALAAGNNFDVLRTQIQEFSPEVAGISSKNNADLLKTMFPKTEILTDDLVKIAKEVDYDIILIAVTGIHGLLPTLEAVKRGKTIALANKETLVTAGDIVMKEAEKYNALIIPVDSEHSAIFQCSDTQKYVKNLIITASGGPFLNKTKEEMQNATKAQTLAHPKWNMGSKITVDSATLMNKGLEVIEAHHLFKKDYENIKVVIHPQSVVHSAIEFEDGSVLAQLGVPSMHLPIQYALTYPKRVEGIKSNSLNLAQIAKLEFFEPDFDKFPMLKLAYQMGKEGGICTAVMNAANEIAVHAFLADKIKLCNIYEIVVKILDETNNVYPENLEDILEADKITREKTLKLLQKGV